MFTITLLKDETIKKLHEIGYKCVQISGIAEIPAKDLRASLDKYDMHPCCTHRNWADYDERLEEAERMYDEKEISICKVVKDYYERTYKDVNRYIHRLSRLNDKKIDEIHIIGHSVAGVDLPYFRRIGYYTKNQVKWIVYYFSDEEKERIRNDLISCGIQEDMIEMRQAKEFYDLQ